MVLICSVHHTDSFKCIVTRELPGVELPTGKDIPRNQSKVENPSKEELVKKHQTRPLLGKK